MMNEDDEYKARKEDEAEERLYRQAIEAWGPHAQTMMLFEEMGELMQAISKVFRAKNPVVKKELTKLMAAEIADVQIMLEQQIVLHQIPKLVNTYRTQKLRKLGELLKGDV